MMGPQTDLPPSVIVHLTPFAPHCAEAEVDARARNRTFWFKPLPAVLASVLRRIRRTAAEIRAVQAGDEIDLMATIDGPEGPQLVPLACIWAGAELDQVRAVLGQLAAQPSHANGVAA